MTVPYSGELDKEDTNGAAHDANGHGNSSAHITLFGVKESSIGRGSIHNRVTGHGAAD